MEVLPDGPLGWTMVMLPVLEGGLGLSLVCRHWDRVLREVCRSMIHEIVLGEGVTDAALLATTIRFQCLMILDLQGCRQVTDVGVQAIGAGCPSLTSLDLTNCSVTDVGVQAIGAGCPILTSINLTWCDNVTDVGLQAIGAVCPSLTILAI